MRLLLSLLGCITATLSTLSLAQGNEADVFKFMHGVTKAYWSVSVFPDTTCVVEMSGVATVVEPLTTKSGLPLLDWRAALKRAGSTENAKRDAAFDDLQRINFAIGVVPKHEGNGICSIEVKAMITATPASNSVTIEGYPVPASFPIMIWEDHSVLFRPASTVQGAAENEAAQLMGELINLWLISKR